MKKEKLIKKAEEYFYNGEYKKALQNFSLALMSDPYNKELQLYAILSDMAIENEEKAQAIFEYYQITKEIDGENALEMIKELIDSMDFDIDILNMLLDGGYVSSDEQFDNSINYDDFIQLIKDRGSFKRAYEDILFSTKVLINSREEFIDFLNKLVDNNYVDTAFMYGEAAISLFPKDSKLQNIFYKIKEKKSIEH